MPTASARPQTNLSVKEGVTVNNEEANGVDEAVSGSLESVVSEFGCDELPFLNKNDEILPLLLILPVSPDVPQFELFVV